MDKKRFFRRLAYLIIFIFVANYFANKFYLYSSIWYFDMIMHFLGGFWIGLVCVYFLFFRTFFPVSLRQALTVLLLVFLVGVGWEIFEIIFNNIIAQSPFNTLDTISDVFFDLAGGTFAILYYAKKVQIFHENEVSPKAGL